MKHLLALLAVLLNIGIASAQIEVTDSTSTEWGGSTDIGVTPGNPTGKVTSLSLSQSRLLLSGGQQAQLVATVNADAAVKSVTWSVADNTIATVSANGLVTAITTGQTVVTATSADGGQTAQCLVTVRNNAKVYVERIDLDITEMEMYVGEVRAVTPTVYPENATDKTLRWEQRGAEYYNPALPDENHVFTAYKPGVIEIKLYPNDGSEAYAVCKITVKDRPLTKMTLPSEIVLNVNEMMTLKPEVSPEPFQRKYKWTVADPSVAYISSSGRIIGVKAGTTTVTATALDGTGISATSKVTVTSSVVSMGYSGWILERGEDIHPWTARCFHEAGYSGKYAPNDSRGNKWYSPDYDDSSWDYAYGPLMNHFLPAGSWWNEEHRTGYGQWELLDKSTLTIRQKFYLPDVSGYDFQVYARVYSSGEVYINGHRVDITDTGGDKRSNSYMAFIDPSYLVMGGENTIAIIGYPSSSEQYLDFGIHYETTIPVTRVVIKQKQLTLDIGATKQLETVVKPAEASHQNVTWASLHPTVATVDQDGNVTGVGEGTATITATSVDGTDRVDSCEVKVTNIKTTAVWLKGYGQNAPWTARYQYCLAGEDLYAYGPTKDDSGRAWTAKDYDDSAWRTVKGPIGHDVSNRYVTLWPDHNSRYYLRATFTINDLASYKNPQLFLAHVDGVVVWINGTKVYEESAWRLNYYVDIPEDVLVEGSNVICIRATEGDGEAYIDFGVSALAMMEVIPVRGITLDQTAMTLRRNDQAQLTATISPADAYYKAVAWTSSNPDIATVDNVGNVRGISAGEAVITVSNKRGQLVTATCRVTVSNGPYTITFDTDGGSEIAPITADYASAVTAPANPTKTGYTFLGWDKEIPTTMPAQDMTIKARWQINRYTITFDTDGGSEIAPITQDYATAVTAPANPTKTGYTFMGWDKEIPTTMPAEDVTIRALWQVNQYTVTFVADGKNVSEQVLDYGTAITVPEAPAKEGYTFTGWTPTVAETVPANDVTYEAVYTINTYKLTYVLDGVEVMTIEVEYGAEIEAFVPEVEDGREFAGWEDMPATMPAHDVTIYGSTRAATFISNHFANSSESLVAYSLHGTIVMILRKAGDIKRLPGGTYIINGRKVIICK